MWIIFLSLSVFSLILSAGLSFAIKGRRIVKKRDFNLFNSLFAGVFAASFFMFVPIHITTAEVSVMGCFRAIFLSIFNSMQIFTFGCEFAVVTDSIGYCPQGLNIIYQVWTSLIFVVAPIFTLGFVLSLFKNASANLRYWGAFARDVYIFSELNDKSIILADNIKSNHKFAAIVFTDVFEGNEESSYELIGRAKGLGAINFKKDILAVDFKKHSAYKNISFFAMGEDETENLNQALKLIETYRNRENTNLYVFSTKTESELLLTYIDKGRIKVRRINEVQSLINRVLYEQGEIIFESARETDGDDKQISAVVVGMGNHGREMVKALTWFGQMDGYRLKINAFDKDPLAEEKFTVLAPELMDLKYNRREVPGEARYDITVHSGIDVQTNTFAKEIAKITDATYVFVGLGNDDVNINTAVNLRMYFERKHIHPVIHAVVYDSPQKKALEGITNYSGQAYDIGFIGDLENAYTETVIIDSELEEDALKRHLKWGTEDEFWTYEYNYRSSVASAIHMRARIKCGIPGAGKKEEELTTEERDIIENLEHRRWNAYMRSEGYIYSGSKEKSSRNNLAKMHHNLIDYAQLTDEDKRKDSCVGTN